MVPARPMIRAEANVISTETEFILHYPSVIVKLGAWSLWLEAFFFFLGQANYTNATSGLT